jgi:hypothetical protein
MGAHLDAVAKSDREAILERFEGGELSVNVFLDSIGEWQRLDSELCARLLMAVLKRALTSSADERQLICEQLSSWLMLREDMRDALAHCNAVELSALQLDVAVLSSASPTAAAAALDTVCAALLAERRFAWCDVYVGVGAPSRHVVAQRCAGLVTAALARLGAFAAEWHASDGERVGMWVMNLFLNNVVLICVTSCARQCTTRTATGGEGFQRNCATTCQ